LQKKEQLLIIGDTRMEHLIAKDVPFKWPVCVQVMTVL